MKVLVTGDRRWTDLFAVDVMIQGLLGFADHQDGPLLVLHGAARGADSVAAVWNGVDGVEVQAFPADWNRYGRSAGPIRNRQMLDEEPDLVVAFHDHLGESKGTRDCVSEARKRGIPVWLVSHPA